MSLSIDLKYTLLLTPRFEKFQRKQDYLFACRCPLCGDSKKNLSKMRGYIYRKVNNLFYRCHNCGQSMSIGNLIKTLDGSLFKEYLMERYKSGEVFKDNKVKIAIDVPSFKFGKLKTDIQYENAERCDKLSKEHFCIKYCESRKMTKDILSMLYYTDNYKKFCDEIYPTHGKEITADKRLVIPFYDENNSLVAISGRALENASEKLRYVTIRTNESNEKLVYGMDRIDLKQPVYIVEGPIDSLFLNNCLASGDSNLALTAKNIKAEKIILIYDNEPRNKEVMKLMQNAIKLGHNVVIWPDTIKGKDINEMIMNGMSQSDLQDIISSNTFEGLRAQTKFTFWKKV